MAAMQTAEGLVDCQQASATSVDTERVCMQRQTCLAAGSGCAANPAADEPVECRRLMEVGHRSRTPRPMTTTNACAALRCPSLPKNCTLRVNCSSSTSSPS